MFHIYIKINWNQLPNKAFILYSVHVKNHSSIKSLSGLRPYLQEGTQLILGKYQMDLKETR